MTQPVHLAQAALLRLVLVAMQLIDVTQFRRNQRDVRSSHTLVWLNGRTAGLKAARTRGLDCLIKLSVESLLRGDIQAQVRLAVEATGGAVLTSNEGRQLFLGLPPVSQVRSPANTDTRFTSIKKDKHMDLDTTDLATKVDVNENHKIVKDENTPRRKIDAVVSLLCAMKVAEEYA